MKQYNSNMKQKKIYESYVTDTGSTLVSNYQLCRSRLDTNGSILRLCEQLLLRQFNKPWMRGCISKAIASAEKKGSDYVISIPKLKFTKKASDILSEFVDKEFDYMVYEVSIKGLGRYPYNLKKAMEKVLRK